MHEHYLPPIVLSWPLIIALAVGGLAAIAAGLLRWRGDGSDASLQAGGLAVAAFALSFFLSLFSVIPTLLGFYAPVIFISPWAGLMAVIAGVGLFWLRKKKLDLYGGLEILGSLAAILVCSTTVYGTASQRAIALVTATYFFVRGLDNAEKGELLKRLRRFRPFSVFKLSFITPGVALVGVIGFIPAKDLDVSPPYMANKDGSRLPVSAIECGSAFIYCDEAAWREHDRLRHGTDEERAAAEAASEVRYRRHLETAEIERLRRKAQFMAWLRNLLPIL